MLIVGIGKKDQVMQSCFALMHDNACINLQVGVSVMDQSHPAPHPQHNPTKIKSRMSGYVLYTTDINANIVYIKVRPV